MTMFKHGRARRVKGWYECFVETHERGRSRDCGKEESYANETFSVQQGSGDVASQRPGSGVVSGRPQIQAKPIEARLAKRKARTKPGQHGWLTISLPVDCISAMLLEAPLFHIAHGPQPSASLCLYVPRRPQSCPF